MGPNGAHILWEEHSTCFLKTCGWQCWQPCGDGTVHVATCHWPGNIWGLEHQPSGQRGTSHRGQDVGKKMYRLRGVEGADGWVSWVGKGQVSPGGNIWVEIYRYPGIQGRSIPGQGKSSCKQRHHCPSHPFFDAKRKERKSIIAFKYLLNKVLLLKLPRIQLSCQYKTYPPLFPFRTQPSHRTACQVLKPLCPHFL